MKTESLPFENQHNKHTHTNEKRRPDEKNTKKEIRMNNEKIELKILFGKYARKFYQKYDPRPRIKTHSKMNQQNTNMYNQMP